MVKTRSVAYRLASTAAPTTEMTTTATTESDRSLVVPPVETSNGPTKPPFLEVSQKKIPIPNPTEDTVKGPIRLRLLRLPPEIHTKKSVE